MTKVLIVLVSNFNKTTIHIDRGGEIVKKSILTQCWCWCWWFLAIIIINNNNNNSNGYNGTTNQLCLFNHHHWKFRQHTTFRGQRTWPFRCFVLPLVVVSAVHRVLITDDKYPTRFHSHIFFCLSFHWEFFFLQNEESMYVFHILL